MHLLSKPLSLSTSICPPTNARRASRSFISTRRKGFPFQLIMQCSLDGSYFYEEVRVCSAWEMQVFLHVHSAFSHWSLKPFSDFTKKELTWGGKLKSPGSSPSGSGIGVGRQYQPFCRLIVGPPMHPLAHSIRTLPDRCEFDLIGHACNHG